jgi:ketosteroid isomerase-like protein
MPATNPLDQNTAVVVEFFRRLDAADLPGALALLADDAAWWIAGTPGRVPGAGDYAKPQVTRLLQAMTSRLQGGMRMHVRSTTAQDDRVSVETEATATLRHGREYRQRQHFLMRIRDGLIRDVREYLDTDHTRDVWSWP